MDYVSQYNNKRRAEEQNRSSNASRRNVGTELALTALLFPFYFPTSGGRRSKQDKKR